MSRVERHAAGVRWMHRCTRCKQNRVQTFRSVELTLQRREGNVKCFITQFTEEIFKIFKKLGNFFLLYLLFRNKCAYFSDVPCC